MNNLPSVITRFIRTISKNTKSIFIIVSGMCLAMLMTLLTISHAKYLYSADSWLGPIDDIYLCSVSEDLYPGLAPMITKSLFPICPEIKDYTVIKNPVDQILRKGDGEPLRFDIYIVDEGFGRMFDITPIAGNLQEALSLPSSIVLCESVASSLFGTTDVMGETIDYNIHHSLTVRAVIPDLPENSSFTFEGLISYASMKLIDPSGRYERNSNNSNIMVQLAPNVNPKDFHKDLYSRGQKLQGIEPSIAKGELIPFNELFFRTDLRDDFYNHCTGNYLTYLIFFSVLLLAIATLNSINLYSAILNQRIKSHRVEMIHGALPESVFIRSIVESVMIMIFTFMVAFLFFKYLSGRLSNSSLFPIDTIFTKNSLAIMFQLMVVITLGLLIGLMSTMSISRHLVPAKLSLTSMEGLVGYKKVFLVLQFFLASLIIMTTIICVRQYAFVNKKDQGFKADNILCFDTYGVDSLTQYVLRNTISNITLVDDVCFTWGLPGDVKDFWDNTLMLPGKETQYISSSVIQASNSFPSLMEMQLLYGEFPGEDYHAGSYLINEKAMIEFGLKESDIGVANMGRNKEKVLGVIKDFNFESLHTDITPSLIYCNPTAYNNCMLIKLNEHIKNGDKDYVSQIKSIWTNIVPELPFNYVFLKDKLKDLYVEDERFFKSGLFFSIFSIFIALMGLVAISSMAGASRSKEIAIRKVNGAQLPDIFRLFTTSFSKAIIAGFILSVPLSYILSVQWLEGFAYKVELHWYLWISVGVLILLVSQLTLWASILPAIRLNPSSFLQDE